VQFNQEKLADIHLPAFCLFASINQLRFAKTAGTIFLVFLSDPKMDKEYPMKTILFDLDGTLLPMDIEQFTRDYCKQLSMFFADIIDGKSLINHVLTATAAVLQNQEERKNEAVFIEHLAQLVPGDITLYLERFCLSQPAGKIAAKPLYCRHNTAFEGKELPACCCNQPHFSAKSQSAPHPLGRTRCTRFCLHFLF